MQASPARQLPQMYSISLGTYRKRLIETVDLSTVVTLLPGVMVIQLPRGMYDRNKHYHKIGEFDRENEELVIDLTKVRLAKNWTTRHIAVIPRDDSPGRLTLASADFGNWKEGLDNFIEDLQLASGEPIPTEDLQGIKVFIGIFAGAFVLVGIAALIKELVT